VIKKNKKKIYYPGWELKFFDNSENFRRYQFQLFKSFIKGNTAEIGPGNGMNLGFYFSKPKRIDLYEPSNNLYKTLKKRFSKKKKIKIFNKKFTFVKKKYHSILYLDVLEHIKEDQIEIKNAYKCLEKNGYLIINVPAFNHLYSKFDKDVGHCKRYKKKDFEDLFSFIKKQKIKYVYYDCIGYFLSLMSKILINDYKKNFEKKIKLWDSLIFISKIFDIIFFNKFGKSLLVIIKKID
jgi:hypothetical protein